MSLEKAIKKPINEWYVNWANSLDSAGEDSSLVQERLTVETIAGLDVTLQDCIRVAKDADKMKKYLFYGKNKFDTFDWNGFVDAISDNHRDIESEMFSHESIRLLHAILGKIDEAGELAHMLYEHLFNGEPVDRTNLREEVGDSRWYDALIAKYLGDDNFDGIDWANYRKLTTRYPEKRWTQSHALERDLDKEKEALNETESTSDS